MVLFLYKSIVVFIVISPKWGLFGIINQIYHASVGILMECLPSETFHHDTHTGMAYLYNALSSKLIIPWLVVLTIQDYSIKV